MLESAGKRSVPFSATIMETMKTNAGGAAATVENFIPLLSAASNPRVVFMSSTAASALMMHQFSSMTTAPALSASKAAVNMIMIYYYHQFPGWKVNACYPGYRVRTLLFNSHSEFLRSASRIPP